MHRVYSTVGVMADKKVVDDVDELDTHKLSSRHTKWTKNMGFDFEFVEEPPKSLQTECPICLLTLNEPRIVSCCGHNFCRACIEEQREEGRPCPLCKATSFSMVHNRSLEGTLSEFVVRCPNTKLGCFWVGKLDFIERHLHPAESSSSSSSEEVCLYEEVECIHGCGGAFIRRDVDSHELQCDLRPFMCPYCSQFSSTYDDVVNSHWLVCGKFLVPCPNRCEVGFRIFRENLEDHLSQDCPLHVLQCDFHYAGCKVMLPRDEMAAHLADTSVHLTLLSKLNHKLSRELVEKQDKIDSLEGTVNSRFEQLTKEIQAVKEENVKFTELLEESNKKVEELETKVKALICQLPKEVVLLPSGRTITLKKADISEEDVSIVVASANVKLAVTSGGAIAALDHRSKGALRKHCMQYLRSHNVFSVDTGKIVVTDAGGGLKCSHVYHAVGPRCHTVNYKKVLEQLITTALQMAESSSCVSIAFSAISAGCGLPIKVLSEVFVDAIFSYKCSERFPVLSDIRVVIIDDYTFGHFMEHFFKKKVRLAMK